MRRATAPSYNFTAVAQIVAWGLATAPGPSPEGAAWPIFVTVTDFRPCAWCGRPIEQSGGRGRPRAYCRRSCRQRDFEARRRARELGLAETDLVVTRRQVEVLDDLVYVLGCAVVDVDAQLASDRSAAQLERSLSWLLEAARPLLSAGEHLRGGQPATPAPAASRAGTTDGAAREGNGA